MGQYVVGVVMLVAFTWLWTAEEANPLLHTSTATSQKNVLLSDRAKNQSASSFAEVDKTVPWCSLSTFRRWYRDDFYETNHVPFSTKCLQSLIDKTSEKNIDLIVALVRRRFPEQIKTPLGSSGGGSNNNSSRIILEKRFLFYRCQSWCGGLGDRIDGATSVFLYALFSRARYGVFIDSPVHWDEFFTPVDDLYFKKEYLQEMKWWSMYQENHKLKIQAQWENHTNATPVDIKRRISRGTTEPMKTFGSPSQVESYFFPPDVNNTSSRGGHEEGQLRVAAIATNSGSGAFLSNPVLQGFLHEYRLAGLSSQEMVHVFMKLYMGQMTPYLRDSVQKHVKQLRGSYVVGMQIRRGNAAGIAWKDPSRSSEFDVECMIQRTRDLCNSRQQRHDAARRPCSVWLTSDSLSAIETVTLALQKENITVFTGKGNITHMDRSRLQENENAKEANLRTFADWYMLGEASDAFVISQSGYSATATLRVTNGSHVGFRPVHVSKPAGRNESYCNFKIS